MDNETINETRKAFDAAAPVYDAAYEALPGIRRMREITSRTFLQYFTRGSRLLEINCGTGNDALFLAQQGMKVLATDLSGGMVAEARKKIAASGFQHSVEAQQIPFDALSSLRPRQFDGGYSNLGGLNCTSDLRSVAVDLSSLVKPGGYFIATIMPRLSPWETAAFLVRLRWREAFRRFRRAGTIASVHGGRVRTYYHSPSEFRAAFAPHFTHVRTFGLAVFPPPPNFARAYAFLGRSVRLLESLDDHLAGFPPFPSFGDHYVTVLRRATTVDNSS